MIIVEGPDGSGKTTLVKRLREDFPQLVAGQRTSPRDNLENSVVEDTFRAYELAIKYEQIYDRLHYSEWVYGPILRGDCKFNLNQMQYFAHLNPYLAHVVICLPPLEVVLSNILKSEQKPGVDEHTHHIYDVYRGLMDPWMLTAPTNILGRTYSLWNYTKDDYDHSLRPTLLSFLNWRALAVGHVSLI